MPTISRSTISTPTIRRRHAAVAIGCALALIGGLGACGIGGADSAADGYPITITNCGREVTFTEQPQRVLALGGEAATLLWAAGATDRISTFGEIVGEPLGDASADLGALGRIEVPGSGEVSRETILSQAPDLVVTFGLPGTNPEDLAAAGVNTLVVAGRCDTVGGEQTGSPLELMYDDIELYGRVFGTESQAAASIDGLRARVQAVRDRVDTAGGTDRRSAAALFITGPDVPLGAYGGPSTAHEQLELLGLRDVFADVPDRYFEPGTETLLDAAPDIVIALYQAGDDTPDSARAAVTGRPELAGIPAVRDDRVLAVDFFYSGNGTLAVDGLELLADQLGAVS